MVSLAAHNSAPDGPIHLSNSSFCCTDSGETDEEISEKSDIWYYCSECRDKAYKEDESTHGEHAHTSSYVTIQGVFVQSNYLTEAEEHTVINDIDKTLWVDSQSGRRKQDFGPKVNFKRKKLKLDTFNGFPAHSKLILDRMQTLGVLSNFKPVEMCNLEYEPSKGSAIDPHFDDFWLWGERLVTINLLSSTCYTLSQERSSQKIVIPLPARSLIVLYGDARNKWMHSIARQHITTRRIGITIRELTDEFLEGGQSHDVGKELLARAALTVSS